MPPSYGKVGELLFVHIHRQTKMKKILLSIVVLVISAIALANLFPEKFMHYALKSERDRNGLEHKTVVIQNETWHYLEGGVGKPETVVMIHGFGGDKDNWTRFAGSITPHYRVISMDLPGFGESARHPGWSYRLGDQKDRLHKFLSAIGVMRFHLVGNSMGGHLTALYTHAFPQQVMTMALFDNAGVREPVASEMTKLREQGINPLIISDIDEYDDLLSFVSSKQPWLPGPAKKYFAQRALDNAPFNTYIYNQYKADRNAGLEGKLRDIRTPTLILWGEEDRVLDKSMIDVMTPLLSNEEVVIMPATGHIPMAERPAETAQHYLNFINKF